MHLLAFTVPNELGAHLPHPEGPVIGVLRIIMNLYAMFLNFKGNGDVAASTLTNALCYLANFAVVGQQAFIMIEGGH